MHVTEYLDTTLKRQVDHMVGLIEPLMILTVGGIMAWIVHSVFVPLYDTLAIMDY
jgi:type II secretory pathway component PulF